MILISWIKPFIDREDDASHSVFREIFEGGSNIRIIKLQPKINIPTQSETNCITAAVLSQLYAYSSSSCQRESVCSFSYPVSNNPNNTALYQVPIHSHPKSVRINPKLFEGSPIIPCAHDSPLLRSRHSTNPNQPSHTSSCAATQASSNKNHSYR